MYVCVICILTYIRISGIPFCFMLLKQTNKNLMRFHFPLYLICKYQGTSIGVFRNPDTL